MRARTRAARTLPVRAKGRDHPRAAIGTIASIASPNVSAGIIREESERRQVRARRAAGFGASRNLSAAAASQAGSPQRTTITRKSIADARAELISQQSRAEPDPPANVEPQTTGGSAPAPAVQNSQRAPHAECARANATGRDHDGSKARTRFKQSCRCPHRRRRRSARRPAASRRRAGAAARPAAAALTPATVRRGGRDRRQSQPASLQMLLAGDGRRARAGRHHGEPDLQARPHARAARHAASAACDVGFSQKQAVVRRNRCSAPQTRAGRPRGQRRRCDQRSRRSIATKPGRAH